LALELKLRYSSNKCRCKE